MSVKNSVIYTCVKLIFCDNNFNISLLCVQRLLTSYIFADTRTSRVKVMMLLPLLLLLPLKLAVKIPHSHRLKCVIVAGTCFSASRWAGLSVCLSVCLIMLYIACISKTTCRNLPDFLCLLSMAMFSSEHNAVRYVVLVFVDDVMSSHSSQACATLRRSLVFTVAIYGTKACRKLY